jgi:hypothetical protein
MKSILVLGLALAVVAFQPAAAQSFRPAEGDFSVTLPDRVVQDKDRDTLPDGLRRYSFTAKSGRYDLAIDQYPAGIPLPTPTKDIYDRLLWARAHDAGATMISSRRAVLAKLPCWEATYQMADGEQQVARVLMLGDRIYALSYTHAPTAPEADALVFFDSFHIAPRSATSGRSVVGPRS